MKKVLILDGNSSHCLPIMKSMEKSGHSVTLVCPGIFSSGYFSRYGHEKMLWPGIGDNESEFYRLLINQLRAGDYDLVMGLSDVSARLLSRNKEEIEKYTECLVPDFKVFQLASDKYLTMKFCKENDIPCPITIDNDNKSIEEVIDEIAFPVVVKPKVGVGAVGFFIINDKTDLIQRLPLLNEKFGPMLVQEYLPNEEQYTVEAFCTHNSDVVACVVAKKTRFFPVNGGTSSCNVTVHYPDIVETVQKLLKEIKWIGSANVDLIVDPRDGTPKIIEINPRVGSIVKIAFLAGVDIADMSVKMVDRVPIKRNNEVPSDIVMRNLMLDLLWFIFSSFDSKRKTSPSFFKFFGRNVHYQNFGLDDPLPSFGYILGNVLKYANIKALKQKLGLN